ncbi:response regulator transcription factor [Streptosporangium sp. NPDC006007]|uniref:response regulator transcription factor n=1 Tax=Streptosporangium sp. NPDC006007 TaxID=3154575 RepID=UPI0033BE660F
MQVLLIEDNDMITEPLIDGLTRYGFTVERVTTGADALRATPGEMVLLDLGLPDMDGIDVCRQLRQSSEVPIIMLTARGEEVDRIVGLEMGADDYLTKPFSLRELVARMRAVARRTRSALVHSTPAPQGLSLGAAKSVNELVLDRRARQVQVNSQLVTLTPKEFDLLALLCQDPGAVYSRSQILRSVWGSDFFGSTKTLDFHVATLRRKLGDPTMIETVRGVGYRLSVYASVPFSSP